MVSRETRVHVVCVVLGIASLVALTVAGVTETLAGQLLAVGLFYALPFAGAHFYFAVRGEGGMVSVTGRWRFVALVTAGIGLAFVYLATMGTTVAGFSAGVLVGWAFAVVLFAYFAVEGVAGYRQSMHEP